MILNDSLSALLAESRVCAEINGLKLSMWFASKVFPAIHLQAGLCRDQSKGIFWSVNSLIALSGKLIRKYPRIKVNCDSALSNFLSNSFAF